MYGNSFEKSNMEKFNNTYRSIIDELNLRIIRQSIILELKLKKEVCCGSCGNDEEPWPIVKRRCAQFGIDVTEDDMDEVVMDSMQIERLADMTKEYKMKLNRNIDIWYGSYDLLTISRPFVHIYGAVDRVGEPWDDVKRIKEEMDSHMTHNTVIGSEVANLSKMVSVAYITIDTEGASRDAGRTHMRNKNEMVVDIDALLIRYLGSMSNPTDKENALKVVIAIALDKIVENIISAPLRGRLIASYTRSFSEFRTTIRDLYLNTLITHIVSESASGTMNKIYDIQPLENIIRSAVHNLDSSATYNISDTARRIQGLLQEKMYGRPKYNVTAMHKLAYVVDNNRESLAETVNAGGPGNGLYESSVVGTQWKYMNRFALESLGIGISESTEYSRSMAVESYKQNMELNSIFSIIGMESELQGPYSKTTRANLMSMLSKSEKKVYINIENEILRYKSDSINCDDASKRSLLLARSKAIGKSITYEESKSTTSEAMAYLLTLVESNKFDVDNTLSARNFVKERNTKMYGQFLPSGDWDY